MANVPDEPPSYVVEPLAARGYLTLLPGKRSSFKSFLAMFAAARCPSGGGDLAGLRCAPARALYVDAENGPRLMRRRFSQAGIATDGMLVADGTRIHLPKKMALGAGIALEQRPEPSAVGAAVRTVLADVRYAERAAAVAADIRALPLVDVATARLRELADNAGSLRRRK